MPIFIFTGKLVPDEVELTLDYKPELRVTSAETIPDTTFKGEIVESRIRVTAEVESYDAGMADRLFSFAHDLARTLAEVASLADGIAYVANINRVTHPDGEERALILADQRLAALFTIFRDFDIEQVFDLVAVDQQLARAISDVVVMLSWSHYTPIAAGRVVDGILRMMTGGRSAEHWEALRKGLRVDRAFLQLVTDEAVPARHGDRRRVDGAVNRQLAERGWILMNRYLHYRMAGGHPLDPVAFPILKGEAQPS